MYVLPSSAVWNKNRSSNAVCKKNERNFTLIFTAPACLQAIHYEFNSLWIHYELHPGLQTRQCQGWPKNTLFLKKRCFFCLVFNQVFQNKINFMIHIDIWVFCLNTQLSTLKIPKNKLTKRDFMFFEKKNSGFFVNPGNGGI